MSDIAIRQIGCLKDNYACLVHDHATGATACIDAPEAAPILKALNEEGWRLTHILVTHHHADHTQAIPQLKQHYGSDVIGPRQEESRIPGLDHTVTDGDKLTIGGIPVTVIETPGHTAGHVAYWMPSARSVFVGDTLFAGGCGRILEGTPQLMWQSLTRLMKLPPETWIYCGHEYTQANLRFALTIEPDNKKLQERAAATDECRARGEPTVPSRLDTELATNPFLRPDSPEIRRRLNRYLDPDWAVFADVRERKNRA